MDEDFRREVEEAARARVTAYGNLNWRERPADEMWVKEKK